MDAADWAAVSAVASAISAAIALRVAMTHARVADFNSCLELVKQFGEAVRRVHKEDSDEPRAREIRELLNLLEAMALLVNKRSVGSSAAYLAHNALIEAWAWFQMTEWLHVVVDEAITGPKTFEQLKLFKRRNERAIEELIARQRALIT